MANLPKADELIGSTVTQQQFKTKLKQLVENIDRSYSTLAEANADIANISVGVKVEVLNTVDGGLWEKKTAGATSLTKSNYDPLSQAKTYTNKYVLGREVELVKPLSLLGARTISDASTVQLEILGNHVNFTDEFFIGDNGTIVPFATTRISDYIPVKPNDSFVVKPSMSYIGAVYDKNLNLINVLTGTENVEEEIVTALNPAAAFVRFNISTIAKTRVYINIEKTELPWLEVTQENIYAAVNAMVNAPTASNLLVGVSFTNGKYLDDIGNPIDFELYSYSDYIEIQPLTNYEVSFASIFVGVFYDQDKNLLEAIPSSTWDGTPNYLFTSPSNAKYLRINIFANDPVKLLKVKNYTLNLKPKSEWAGKTIAWYGTSIPAGYPHSATDAERDVFSHANLAVHDLGGKIINKCVPAGGIGLGVGLSFARTTDAINYQNSLLSLIGTVNEPNLVVFDYGVNDYDQSPVDINNFDPNNPFNELMSIDSRDMNTFIGAYNTIIDAMLTQKVDLKFCFITHFSDDNANPSIVKKQDFFKQMNIVIEALAQYWSAPILKLHQKTGYRNRNGFNSITSAMPDHIHPATGNGKSVESLRNILRDFLISIA